MYPSCFLPTVHKTASPSLHGVPRVVPPAQRYYETLRLPDSLLAALRFLRLAIPWSVCVSSPFGHRRTADGSSWSLLYRLLPIRSSSENCQDLPSSRGTPVIIRPVLGPRRDQARWRDQVSLMPGTAPARRKDEGSPRRTQFRGSIARRLISLSTLRSESHLSPRKTHFRLLARLCRSGLVTRRVPIKGFTSETILLFRASWRNASLRHASRPTSHATSGTTATIDKASIDDRRRPPFNQLTTDH